MCACRLGPLAPAPLAGESAGDCRTPQRACCVHRKHAARHNVEGPVASNSKSLRESHVPAGPGETHEPGCPALQTADHSKFARQNQIDSPVLTVQQDRERMIEAVPAGTTELAGGYASPPSSCPLYLSLRTLLI